MAKELSNKELWENVLVDIELSISRANFSTWFKDTHIVRQEEGIVHLGVPNTFAREWLSDKFHKLILKTLRNCSETIRGLEYSIVKDAKQKKTEENQNQPVPLINKELPLSEYYTNRTDNLNPRYTLDNFVVGPFNELAHAAAQAVIQKPGISYNPLFIYGETGRGKTHLIQAVGNQLKKASQNKKIHYITSERFTVDYITAVQNASVNVFKEKYRQYDVFIMDDIQFLSKKEKTQEELFHLFNALHDNNKQIVFSSDKHPNYIPQLEERLKSRFSAGMIVDIPSPDHESRMAILSAKALSNNFILSDDIVDHLATEIQGNIRELEGALNSIICQTQLKGKTLSLSEVKNIIKNNAHPKKLISAKEVIKKVSEFYAIDESSIYEKTRRKEIVRPRQLIMYILREDFNISYPAIGQKLGGRDHTTVIHSYEKVKNDLKVDSGLSQELNQVRTLLK